ncbi:hypothetical protein OAW22_02390 [Pseudomonadales bacterium]|nr:hypothetical protein [Pseudomonadales bacterium]
MSLRSAIIILLNKNLVIKNTIKFLYYNTFHLLGILRGSARINLRTAHDFQIKTIGKRSTFFGYYDFLPVREGIVLYHEVDGDTRRKPNEFSKVHIYATDLNSCDRQLVAVSTCFNWQQGARVNWVDDKVVYNTMTDGDLPATCFVDFRENKESVIPGWHYQAHDSKYIYFLNYYAIAELRPDYGYFNDVGDLSDAQAQNAIFVLEQGCDGDPIPVITEKGLREEFNITPDISVEINHLLPVPNGAGFVFILRRHWKNRRDGALLFYDNDDGKLTQLTSFGIVSHVAWRSESTLFGYFQSEQFGLTYQSLDVKSGKLEDCSWLTAITKGDGHPSFASENVCFTDTYPDKYGIQRLFKVDFRSRTATVILENFHGKKFRGEVRCDFHPRAIDEDNVLIDAISGDVRKLAYLSMVRI